MNSPRTVRVMASLAVLGLSLARLSAEPAGTVSAVREEGVMVTSLSDPEFFVFRSGVKEEHFDGTAESMDAQGGIEVGEPITGLHYMRPRASVNGPVWNEQDRKLLEAQFHGAGLGSYYLFKTIEGRLFFLPKEGETAVVRVDYTLNNGHKVTVWMRK